MKKEVMQKQSDKKSIGKLTTSEQDKELLYKKLIANDVEGLRKMDVEHLDLNIFEPVENMEFIDEEISPLIYCAFYGRTDLAKVLLENKLLDCDLQTSINRHTPLTVACLGSNYQMVKLLVDKGAEVNKPNLFFQTPLIVTLMRLIEEYQSFQQNRICLRIAELLLIHGADPNWVFQKQKGYNLLHFLCSSNIKMNRAEKQLNYDLIRFLLNHGANVNQKTLTDKKPIDLLSGHCNAAALSQLLSIAEEKQTKTQPSKRKCQDDSKLVVRKSKTLLVVDQLDSSGTKSKAERSNYSRDQEVEWYKNNLLNIHGIRKGQ